MFKGKSLSSFYLFVFPKQLYCQPCNNGMQFRLNEINSIKYHFMAEIHKRITMRKTLSKYMAAFNYFDILLVSSPTKW